MSKRLSYHQRFFAALQVVGGGSRGQEQRTHPTQVPACPLSPTRSYPQNPQPELSGARCDNTRRRCAGTCDWAVGVLCEEGDLRWGCALIGPQRGETLT